MNDKKQIEEMAKDLTEFFNRTPMELSFKHDNGECDIITDNKALKVLDDIVRQALIPVFCEAFYNAGYQNCKDKVVLTREEAEQVYETVKDYGKLLKDLQEAKAFFAKEIEEIRKEVAKQFEECKKQTRKETAREVIKAVKNMLKGVQECFDGDEGLVGYEQSSVDNGLNELARQLGVEVE